MYLKDKAALITIIINVVARRLQVSAAACLRKSSPHSKISQARLFIVHIIVRVHKLPYDDVVAALDYADRTSVWYTLKSASKILTRKLDAQLMQNICTEIASLTKVSKTSVYTGDNYTLFLKSPHSNSSGYQSASAP